MDKRDFAGQNKWYKSLDDKTMTATINIFGEDEGCQTEETIGGVPFKYKVCEVCNGKGTYVNPNIDRNGLTSEDFINDPDFAKGYFSGNYDVTCNECCGSRVTPIYDEERADSKIKEIMKEHQDYIREYAKMLKEDCHTRIIENGGYY